jgi:hypothetical protein
MVITKRILLIVEDDKILNRLYKIHCEEVLKELPHIEGVVEQAFNYRQAESILKRQPVDFISVDIALSRIEEGKTDQQREEREAGGMILLKQLQMAGRRPLAVIVSGETLLSYAIDAYKKYGILAFYQKDRFNIDEYQHAVKAILWYLDASELIEKPEVVAAAESWQKALAAAKIAGIKEQQFPESIGDKLETRWTHTVTGLPAGRWTEEILRNRAVERRDWALIRVTVKGFSKFTSVFASQEEPVLAFTGEVLRGASEQFPDQEFFIGHLGYREVTLEPNFVVILGKQTMDRVADIAVWIKSEFDKKEGLFVPAFEDKAKQQELILAVETKILKGSDYFFEDLHRLLDTLGSARL